MCCCSKILPTLFYLCSLAFEFVLTIDTFLFLFSCKFCCVGTTPCWKLICFNFIWLINLTKGRISPFLSFKFLYFQSGLLGGPENCVAPEPIFFVEFPVKNKSSSMVCLNSENEKSLSLRKLPEFLV